MVMGTKLLLVALLIPAASADDKCSADKNNGFALNACGSDKNNTKCCHPIQQACLSGTPKGGDEQFECSANRALYGMKVVTVLVIPICSCIFLLVILVIMAKKVKATKPKPGLELFCLAQTVFSFLVVFSPLWKFALYSSFVAVIVFYMMNVKGNKWVLLAIVTLQIFNLVATIGAYGTSGTFVPLGLLSADNVKSWELGAIDSITPEAGCSAYYGNYFDVANVELQHEGADPLVKFYGYCNAIWLTTVGAAVAVKAVIQLLMLVLSLQLLGGQLEGKEDELKAVA